MNDDARKGRNIMLAVIAGGILAGAPAAAQVKGAECPVQIVLSASSFRSSHEVGAQLASNGVDQIYLPAWLPRSLRIEPAPGESTADPALEPTTDDIKADKVSPLGSRVFRFEHPDLVGIRWSDVGVRAGKGGFKVPAGTYRMRLVFAVVPPADQRGPLVHLCTIYSAAFTLAKEDKWTEFY